MIASREYKRLETSHCDPSGESPDRLGLAAHRNRVLRGAME